MRKRQFGKSRISFRIMAVIVISMMTIQGVSWGAVLPPPFPIPPLSQIPIPGPTNLTQFVKNVTAARKLGKAFFWDMQVGSDGIQACATCHFHAGVDSRTKNQLNPGADGFFDPLLGGTNYTFLPTDFPFHERQSPDFQDSPVIRDINDVAGSQGIRKATFVGVTPGSRFDIGNPVGDPVFNLNGSNTRQVTGRNSPSVINAAFNFANFWDGRANNIFNGENPFGPADVNAGVWTEVGGVLVKQPVAIDNASLASQATGPPLSDVEMSFAGRTFPDLGRKMLSLTPLGIQKVHPTDSVLGSLSKAVANPDGTLGGQPGLNTTYAQMIRDAFQDIYWNSNATTPGGFSQMEANFSLFWGLAVQLYEMTLKSDQTPFDQFLAGNDNALTPQQKEGLGIFYSGGRCFDCHGGPELSNATFNRVAFVNLAVNELINFMFNGAGVPGIYDEGYYNVGVRPTAEDLGRGGTAPFFNLLDGGNPFPLSFSRLAELQALGKLPFATAVLPALVQPTAPTFVDGAFKVPILRNVELTAPYFHNGSVLTLEEAVDFYTRGGNYPETNVANIPPAISQIDVLAGSPDRMASVVAFLKSFTDERVRKESAPFDHPELIIPNGEPETDATMILISATGSLGSPPVTVSLSTDVASPQPAGSTINFTATKSGGVQANYNYQFWMYTDAAGWHLVQDYGPSAIWQLPSSTPEGFYTIQVNVRREGATVESEAMSRVANFRISAPAATGVSLTSSPLNSQTAGTPVTFTAQAQGSSNYEYQFWMYTDTTGWSLVQDYGSSASWQMPGTTPVGFYTIQVNVRGAGSGVESDVTARVVNFRITAPAATGVNLAANPPSVQTIGNTVDFTAQGVGSTNYEYQFWMYTDATGWSLVQDFGPTEIWQMPGTTPAGFYTIQVNVRGAGTNVESDAIARVVNYQVTAIP